MEKTIHFGDYVQVVPSELTKKAGLEGLIGRVYGEATPSISSIVVLGELKDDYALNVYFGEFGKTYWIAPQLLRLVLSCDGFEFGEKEFKVENHLDNPDETLNNPGPALGNKDD